MEPNFDLTPTMPDNASLFEGDPFFGRFQLRHAPQPLELTPSIRKNYTFPTFYRDVTCAIGIFHCDYERAVRIMPDSRVRPVRMTRGRSLVIFSCYEYKQVLGVAPYNEIAMTIPVLAGGGLDLPVLPAIATQRFKHAGYYVFHMPVTSKENEIRGRTIWGLPKVTQAIRVRMDGRDCVTTAHEADGSSYFELRVPTTGRPREFDVNGNLYSSLGGKIVQSTTSFQSTFALIQYPSLLWRKRLQPDRRYLTIGDGPSAAVLRDLDLEEHPFQFRYSPSMRSAFDLPNPGFELR